MSPRTKLAILALLVGVILASLLYLIGVQFGFGYFSLSGVARIVVILALILFAALAWVAEKIGRSVFDATPQISRFHLATLAFRE